MGLLDIPVAEAQTEPTKQHTFLSSNIDGFLSEMKTKKQDTGVNEDDDLGKLPPPAVEEEEQEDEPLEKLKATNAFANVTGDQLTLLADAVIPVLIAIMLKDDPDKYRADDYEREQLQKAFADYAQLEGVNLPPWVVLVGTVLAIYGYKGYNGFKQKKIMSENEALKKKLEKFEAKKEEEEENRKEQ